MQNEFYQDLMDAYLQDALSTAERQAFEQQLSQNAELKAAFEQHAEIVNAIQQYRKQEIKRRLESIDIETPVSFWGQLTENVGLKTTAMLGVGIISATMIYYAIPNLQTNDKTTEAKTKSLITKTTQKAERKNTTEGIQAPTTKVKETPEEDKNSTKTNTANQTPKVIAQPPKAQEAVTTKIQKAKNTDSSADNRNKLRQATAKTKEIEGVAITEVKTPLNDKTNLDSNTNKGIELPQVTPVKYKIEDPDKFLKENPNKLLYRFNYDNIEKKPNIERKKGTSVGIIRLITLDNDYYLFFNNHYYSTDKNQLEFAEPIPVTDTELLQKLQEQNLKPKTNLN